MSEIKKLLQTENIVQRVGTEENISTLQKKYNTTRDSIVYSEPLQVGQWVCIKMANIKVHIVRPMETMRHIATKYNIAPQDIMERNKLKTASLFVGQRLIIE